MVFPKLCGLDSSKTMKWWNLSLNLNNITVVLEPPWSSFPPLEVMMFILESWACLLCPSNIVSGFFFVNVELWSLKGLCLFFTVMSMKTASLYKYILSIRNDSDFQKFDKHNIFVTWFMVNFCKILFCFINILFLFVIWRVP